MVIVTECSEENIYYRGLSIGCFKEICLYNVITRKTKKIRKRNSVYVHPKTLKNAYVKSYYNRLSGLTVTSQTERVIFEFIILY